MVIIARITFILVASLLLPYLNLPNLILFSTLQEDALSNIHSHLSNSNLNINSSSHLSRSHQYKLQASINGTQTTTTIIAVIKLLLWLSHLQFANEEAIQLLNFSNIPITMPAMHQLHNYNITCLNSVMYKIFNSLQGY